MLDRPALLIHKQNYFLDDCYKSSSYRICYDADQAPYLTFYWWCLGSSATRYEGASDKWA